MVDSGRVIMVTAIARCELCWLEVRSLSKSTGPTLDIYIWRPLPLTPPKRRAYDTTGNKPPRETNHHGQWSIMGIKNKNHYKQSRESRAYINMHTTTGQKTKEASSKVQEKNTEQPPRVPDKKTPRTALASPLTDPGKEQ